MPRYRVYLQTIASTHVEVEAEDKEEAIDLAYEQEMPYICASCSGWGPGRLPLELGDEWTTDTIRFEPDRDYTYSVEELES